MIKQYQHKRVKVVKKKADTDLILLFFFFSYVISPIVRNPLIIFVTTRNYLLPLVLFYPKLKVVVVQNCYVISPPHTIPMNPCLPTE